MPTRIGSRKVFIALDFETTGLSPPSARVVEIGAVKIRDGEITDRFQTLVNPGVWSYSAAMIHQIPYDEVCRAPIPSTAFAQLSRFIGNHPVVAHNCIFEQKFLSYEYARLGVLKTNDFYCTMRLARNRFPKPLVENHKLQTLLEAFAIVPTGPLHRALPDAEATAELWRLL